nr:DMT family transporter [Arthrobacter zhangbolii]
MKIHKQRLNLSFRSCPLVLRIGLPQTRRVPFSPGISAIKTPGGQQRRVASLFADRKVDLLLLLVAIVWGSSYLAAKNLTGTMGVSVILSLRFLITSLALSMIWLIWQRRRTTRRELIVGVVLGLTQAAVLILETHGIAGTSATNAGLIISLVIVFTPVTESIAFRVKLPRTVFVAGIVAVTGVCLLVSGNGFVAPGPGDMLMLAAAAVRSIHVTAVSALTRGGGYSALNLTVVQSAVCAVLYTLADYRGVLRAVQGFDLHEWGGVLYLGLACSVFAFLVQTWAIQQTSGSRASLLMGTEPIWAVLIGITIGQETLAVLGFIGAALIIIGTYIGLRAEARHRSSRHPVSGGIPEAAAPQASGSGALPDTLSAQPRPLRDP